MSFAGKCQFDENENIFFVHRKEKHPRWKKTHLPEFFAMKIFSGTISLFSEKFLEVYFHFGVNLEKSLVLE